MKKACCLSPALSLFSLLLLLAAGPAPAQLLWQRLVSTPALQETGKFMPPAAGGFVMLGKSSHPVPQGLYLSKANYVGDTVWTRRTRT